MSTEFMDWDLIPEGVFQAFQRRVELVELLLPYRFFVESKLAPSPDRDEYKYPCIVLRIHRISQSPDL